MFRKKKLMMHFRKLKCECGMHEKCFLAFWFTSGLSCSQDNNFSVVILEI